MFNIHRILDAAAASAKTMESRLRVEEVMLFNGYAEPGYDGDKVALGNWNDVSHYDKTTSKFVKDDDVMPRLSSILEKLGYEVDWNDEYVVCEECNKPFRCSPSHYGWMMSGIDNETGCFCQECIDPEEHLESLERQGSRCNTLDINPEDHNYILIRDDFENGLHCGQDASPKLIAEILDKIGCKRYLFNLDSTGQFDLDFSLWLHSDEANMLDKAKCALQTNNTDGPSNSEALSKALKSVPVASSDEGVVYSEISLPDGKCNTRVVSPQDFANGDYK